MKGRNWFIIGGVAIVLVLLITVLLCLYFCGPLRRRSSRGARSSRVPQLASDSRYDCEKIWGVFEKAYEGQDPCDVPVGAYGPLLAAVPFPLKCNQMMLWSDTKAVVHDFTKKSDCYVAMEDTLLGSVLDGQSWCGYMGSSGTYTNGCPGQTQCEKNAINSFWNGASAAFAEAACGDVTVMLNGAEATPFDSSSTFARFELPQLRSPRVKSLTVVLVTKKNVVTNCKDASLMDLQRKLAEGITYDCKDVSEAQIYNCFPNPPLACASYW